MNTGLRVMVSALGIALCLLSVFLNFQLYTSLVGSSNIEKFSYQYIGVALDFSKIVCLLLAVFLWFRAGRMVFGTLCFIFYVILSGISLSAGWGFSLKATQNGENERLKNSFAYTTAQSQIKAIDTRASEYSGFAAIDVQSIKSRVASLESEIATLQSDLAKCPRNYFTACINPKKQAISEKQALLAPLNKQLNGYNAYQGALQQKSDILATLSSADSKAFQNEIVHPLFVATGNLFNVDPEQAKQVLLLVSFVTIELLGSLFFAIGLMFSGGGNAISDMPFSAPQTAYMPSKGIGKPNPYELQNQLKNRNTARLNENLNERLNGAESPRSENVDEVKTPRSIDRSNAVKQPVNAHKARSKGSADTLTSGQGSKRYEHVKQLVNTGQIKPSLYALTKVKYASVTLSKDVAREYQKAMLAEGIIEQTPARNGKLTYRLKGGV